MYINMRWIKMVRISIFVLSVITVLAITYAAFTGQLNITGTAVNRQSGWDIHFENVSNITTSGTAKVLNNHQPTINPNNHTQIQDYEVSLTSPNDSISFTFDVVNDGNYNASISDIDIGTPQCTSTDTTSATNTCNNLTYTLRYASGATVNTNDILYAKDKLSFKVTLQFNDITNPALLPSAGVSIGNLGIEIDFEQQGNALVNDDGTVANNRVYHQGDKITLNNEDYWVIANSGAGQDYVVALKDLPLTVAEVNNYGAGHINRYTQDSIGTAYNRNGYGGIAYYSSETCGYINGSTISTGCINDYTSSEIKYVVDSWTLGKFQNHELKEVDGYSARLITRDEYIYINSYSWRYGSTYWYWTMTQPISSSYVYLVDTGGSCYANSSFGFYAYFFTVIRPVINVYKSALETNNNE